MAHGRITLRRITVLMNADDTLPQVDPETIQPLGAFPQAARYINEKTYEYATHEVNAKHDIGYRRVNGRFRSKTSEIYPTQLPAKFAFPGATRQTNSLA